MHPVAFRLCSVALWTYPADPFTYSFVLVPAIGGGRRLAAAVLMSFDAGVVRCVLRFSASRCPPGVEFILLWRQELRHSRHLTSPGRLSACWRRPGLEHMCTASCVRACWRQELRPSRHLTSPSRLSALRWRRLGLAWSAWFMLSRVMRSWWFLFSSRATFVTWWFLFLS